MAARFLWPNTNIHITTIKNDRIQAAATVRDITNALPRDGYDSYDVTLVVCMLNDVAGDAVNSFSETSTVGDDICRLCERLKCFRRPILVVGSNADLRGFGIVWNVIKKWY